MGNDRNWNEVIQSDEFKALSRLATTPTDSGIVTDEGLGCIVPPDGWTCSRKAGHDGPCAASPVEESGIDEVDEVAIAIAYQKHIGGTVHDMARAAIEATGIIDERKRIGELENALRAVRADIMNVNGFNSQSIACTVWHSEIETTVDFIDASLPQRPTDGEG